MDVDSIAEADVESNSGHSPLQQLDSLLAHLPIGVSQLTAAEFVDIDSCIPSFNEWDDDEYLKYYIQIIQDDNEDEESEEELLLLEQPSNLFQALEMLRKLHLYDSTEQPQFHNLIYDLESQLTDIYLESEMVKQSSIRDYFPCA